MEIENPPGYQFSFPASMMIRFGSVSLDTTGQRNLEQRIILLSAVLHYLTHNNHGRCNPQKWQSTCRRRAVTMIRLTHDKIQCMSDVKRHILTTIARKCMLIGKRRNTSTPRRIRCIYKRDARPVTVNSPLTASASGIYCAELRSSRWMKSQANFRFTQSMHQIEEVGLQVYRAMRGRPVFSLNEQPGRIYGLQFARSALPGVVFRHFFIKGDPTQRLETLARPGNSHFIPR